MSKIFDALENAQKEGVGSKIPAGMPPVPSVSLPKPLERNITELNMEQEMLSLYQTIVSALPYVDHPSVLLVGSRSNEGTSTIARELAKAASLRLEKNVLLIDLDRSRPEHHVYTNIKTEEGNGGGSDSIVPADQNLIEHDLRRVEESSLYIMPLFERSMITPRTIESAKDNAFWEPLKERFDLIIVDSPPVMLFPDGPAIVSKVDGVVLVVEAEKTKWQVALNVKDRITRSGGNIIGTVFNKRKYYIPDFIYKYL
ncbi:MAG TPA: CpsD/CapB family tyrosine-protein kinase [Syntrophorhabdaceae bacterium]|nr:CpsD/CapB family tyrosine-protein kinase [Syntrophorhabdaceae bacterium]